MEKPWNARIESVWGFEFGFQQTDSLDQKKVHREMQKREKKTKEKNKKETEKKI